MTLGQERQDTETREGPGSMSQTSIPHDKEGTGEGTVCSWCGNKAIPAGADEEAPGLCGPSGEPTERQQW